MSAITCEQIGRAVLGEPTKRAGAELLWHCSNHEDRHESLSINPKKDVFLCAPCNASGTAWQFASFLARLDPGDKQGVTAWLKERGLLYGRQPAKAANGHGPCVAEYVYHETNGNPVARKLRFEPGADGRKKDFTLQRWENGAWICGLGSVKTPLYRLPEIQDEPFVILTEGEKDADAGGKIGLATTTSGSVNSFRDDHAEALRDKDVVIVADADDPGREHAQRVAAMLHGKAASLKLCEIPGSKDLAEAIEKGVPKSVLLALFEDTPEWKPTGGREILDSVLAFIRRFVALAGNQVRIVALWAAHTHVLDVLDCTPYLSVNSAEKQSGKTRLLEVLETLVREPWLTGRVTAAVLTRKIDAVKPTLLLDESDAAFGGEKEYAEALRGILNSGYRRGGKASCCVGQGANTSYKDFETFCAKAIAGIGKLPDTVADRSIPIQLKRAKRGEVEKFRKREVEREASQIKARLGAWCARILEELRDARPAIPEQLSDRQADCCEPMLAIADLAGGDWPDVARRALLELCAEGQADDQSAGVRLLADIRQIFAERQLDRISSADLVGALIEIETSPWAELSHGKPITKSKLARILGRFGITPDSIRFDDGTRKGYKFSDFKDAFSRYLSHEKNGTTEQSA
ncbi:MAG TPA: DUF3631 domain-containing protein [Candidatus Dormibacteraeota bacterium]|nr:DUF3631 domain-containing protein [Candidatus Dormibacteraeota bacterium]